MRSKSFCHISQSAAPFPSGLLALAVLAVMGIAPGFAVAQPAPRITPRDLRPDLPVTPPAQLPEPAPAAAPQGAETLFVTLQDVQVEGGFPEFAAQTQALAAPLAGQRVAATAFYGLADAIEALYRAAGYVLVRVTLPPQTVKDGGTLRLLVVDGFLEHVDVSNLPPRAQPAVQNMLGKLVGQRRLRAAQLERALTLAGRAPGVALRSTLAPGAAAGASVLVIEGEFDAVGGSFSLDNRQSDAQHPWQGTLQGRANQVLGLGEQAYLYVSGGAPLSDAFTHEAKRRVGGGGLIVPIGDDGLTLNPEFTWSSTITRPTFFTPKTVSRFRRLVLRFGYPVVLARGHELNVHAALEAAEQLASAPDFAVTLSQDRLRILRFGFDLDRGADWLQAGGRMRLSATASLGLNAFGARSREEADTSGMPLPRFRSSPEFQKLEAGATYEQPLLAGLVSRSMLRAQFTSDVLPSAELFSLDGDDALSAIRTGTLSEDRGWTLRQEFGHPVQVPLAGNPLNFMPYVYGAVGRGYGSDDLPAATDRNTAFGIGVRTSYGPATLALEYGRWRSRPSGYAETQLFVKGQVQF